jgi:hypothetical protein
MVPHIIGAKCLWPYPALRNDEHACHEEGSSRVLQAATEEGRMAVQLPKRVPSHTTEDMLPTSVRISATNKCEGVFSFQILERHYG